MNWIDPVNLERQIRLLDDTRFVELMNALLSETAAKNGIERLCIATNLNIKEPDGGIDARCVNAIHTAGRLIPSSDVDYQFKGGSDKKSAARIVAEDITSKPRVVEGIRLGHSFVFATAWERSDRMEELLLAETRGIGIPVNDGQLVFMTADSIARSLSTFPGLVAQFLGWDMPLVDLNEWSSFRRLGNPFETDDALQAMIKALREQIEIPGSITRIVGAAGDGKTRLVMETLRGSELASSVLYAREVNEVTAAFIAHLRRTPDIQCTLVVDEVRDDDADVLSDRFSGMPAGVRLVMVGLDASGRAPQGTFQVVGLSEQVLSAAILALVPGLPADTVALIARDCARSPKLAVLIAGRIKEEPGLVAPHQLLADGPILNALDRYLDIDPTSAAWQAISVTALLTRLGWVGEFEVESDTLFRAVELDPSDARRHVQLLDERYGIAPSANRLRYVSPAILADRLAARQLGSWTRDKLTKVLAALTPAMIESFARRVRRMHSVLENRTVVEEVILGDQGPFCALTDLEEAPITVLLRHLAGPFPWATLRALRRVIGNATVEELKAATKSRREIVWALEELLWREDTFESTAELLLNLAVAENENFGNNASQIWVSAFQTMLGRTAAGPIVRARVLGRAAADNDPRARKLTADAIGAALRSEHLSRVGMPPDDVEGIPSEEWRPPTYKAWSDALIAYLNILPILLKDDDEEVRISAAGALAAGLHTVATLPKGSFERWTEVASTLFGTNYEMRESVLNSIQWTRNRLQHLLDEPTENNADEASGDDSSEDRRKIVIERMKTLEDLGGELLGTDFSSRFRLFMDSSIWRTMPTRRKEEQENTQRELEEFANEALAHPELLDEKEWKWLLNDKKWRGAERWVEILGKLDINRVFASALQGLATESSRAAMWFSLYELARATTVNEPDYLDARINEMRREGVSPTQIFDLVYRSGYRPSRFQLIRELLNGRAVPPEYVNQLAYYPWGVAVPSSEALELAQIAEAEAENSDLIIPYVSNYVSQVPDAKKEFVQIALRLLIEPRGGHKPNYAIDEWVELAHKFVTVAPVQIAKAALKRIADYQLFHATEYIDRILEPAWRCTDKELLFGEVFAPEIVRRDAIGWHLRQELAAFPFEELGVQFLFDWVSEDPKKRAHNLADVLGPPAVPASELHALLLEKFDAEGVGSAFMARFMSGSFVGSAANWTRGKLEHAQKWLNDDRPAIVDWATRVVSSLERDLERELAREAEEPLLN